jgi:hypothetical protein
MWTVQQPGSGRHTVKLLCRVSMPYRVSWQAGHSVRSRSLSSQRCPQSQVLRGLPLYSFVPLTLADTLMPQSLRAALSVLIQHRMFRFADRPPTDTSRRSPRIVP